MPAAPPIGPNMSDARAYELALVHTILNPTMRDVNARIASAGRSYWAIGRAIDGLLLPQHPALQKTAGTVATKHLQAIAARHKARFHQVMRRFLGVRADFMSDAFLGPLLYQAVQDNVSLIVTIPSRLHASMTADLQKLGRAALFDEKKLADLVAKNYGSAGYNLRRIARDQTSKLVGQLNQHRQTQAGIDQYKWRDSGDASVRASHRANNGKVFRWDSPPPATGHPGHDVQCRCVPLAYIPPKVRPRRKPPAPRKPPAVNVDRPWPLRGTGARTDAGTDAAARTRAVKEHYADFRGPRLSREEARAIHSYTQESGDINGILREGENYITQAPRSRRPEIQRKIASIDSALRKAPAAPEDTVVWRGTSRNSWTDGLQEGTVARVRDFLSTSTKPSVAKRFTDPASPVVLEIRARRGAYIDPLSAASGIEFEFLIPRGSRFFVRRRFLTSVEGREALVIQLDQVE